MQQRCNLTHFILAGILLLGLTTLMVGINAQAQIAFVSDRDGNEDIYVMDTNGKNQRKLTNHPEDEDDPSWSPDGQQIAFERDWEIYVMDTDGQNPQRLTDNPAVDHSPSWSPDGKHIAFVSGSDGKAGDRKAEIYVMDADGRNPRNLTKGHSWGDFDPSWSPDSKRIAFSSFGRNGRKMDIYVMDVDGQNPRQLTNNPLAHDYEPAWYSPAFAVAPAGKQPTMWGWLKQVVR